MLYIYIMKYSVPYSITNLYDKMAVIVEPRKHKNLVNVILNFVSILPDDWKIKLFHGNTAYDFIMNSKLKDLYDSNKLLLQNLDVDNLNALTYSDLFKTKKFWLDCLAENILIFQTDSILCSKSKFKINDFMHFDYIGSVWSNIYDDRVHGGNGGFSFRKQSAMIECIERIPPSKTTNTFDYNRIEEHQEDLYFVLGLAKLNKKLATKQDCINFGAQHYFGGNSFGTHRFYDFLPLEQRESFINYCPEGNIIKPDQKGGNSHIPIFIIVHDRIKVLKQSIASYEKFIKTPFKIILHDVASTFKPCLDYLEEMKAKGYLVYRTETNHHHTVMESVNTYLDEHPECKYYVITDPDVELDNVNGDILEFYAFLLDKFNVKAVGPKLRIDDIPDYYPRKNNVLDNNKDLWSQQESEIEYKGNIFKYIIWNIDTTFQLRSVNNRVADFPIMKNAILCSSPYSARHLDWYINPNNLSEDQIFYAKNTTKIANWGSNSWKGQWMGRNVPQII